MKKFKFLIAVAISVIILLLSVTGALAATVYTVGGYSYVILNNSEIGLCGWDNRTPELVVPAEIADRELVEVSKYGLDGNDGFSTLDFSQATNLKTIGYGAFMNCTGISNELSIPIQVKVIGASAFENCTGIPSVTLYADAATIQDAAFKGCTSLESVVIKGYTQSINYQAFADCPNLTYVEIPDSVTFISAQAFKNSPNVVIGCYSDTAAHQYAATNHIDHKILDRQLGDVNFDGAVDVFDATEIQKYAAEKVEFSNEQFDMGDINQDGYVDVMDALLVQKSVVGKYDILPIIVRY